MFSLRTLFLAVAAAALGIAALFAQTRLWTSAFVGVGLAIIIGATVVAVYRRTMGAVVFSSVAWLYTLVVISSHLPLLQAYAPTTILLIESWWASHKPAQVPVQPSRSRIGAYGSAGPGRPMRNPVVTPDEKEELYKRAILNAFIDGDPSFLHFYTSGQMLCTLIVALIAAQCAAFFLRSKTPV